MDNPIFFRRYFGRLLFVIFVILVVVATVFFVVKNIKQRAALSKNFTSYVADINQDGGIDSHTFTANIQADTGEQLTPPDNFISVRLQTVGASYFVGDEPAWVGSNNSMWIGCKKDGYILTSATSPTGNQLDTFFMGIPRYPVGVEILDKSDNAIKITCTEDWSSWNQQKS